VSEAVALAGARPIRHHRSREFEDLLRSIDEKLKQVFRTQGIILHFTASGTGAMEACVVNLLRSGEEAIVIVGGKFGERWAELCQTFGVEVHPIDVPWGRAVRPEALKSALQEYPQARTVFATLFETSTATTYDIEALARVTRAQGALLVVDAISGLGTIPLEMDAWGVEAVVGASQKMLQTPPGLSFVALNERAWHQAERPGAMSYYWDFRRARKELFFTPFTPAVLLLTQLDASLTALLEEGLESVRVRAESFAQATRAAAAALGLKLFSERPGAVCTAIEMPDGIHASQVVETLRERFGIWIAEGQGPLKEKIIRIAHIGEITESDLIGALGTLELVLRQLGHPCELGRGVSSALAILEGTSVTES
jgi:aspartate aminotransferase-like enzyme